MKIDFFGAVNSVTGSCHRITVGDHKILLDCGLYQGGKTLEELNEEPFPFVPAIWIDLKELSGLFSLLKASSIKFRFSRLSNLFLWYNQFKASSIFSNTRTF